MVPAGIDRLRIESSHPMRARLLVRLSAAIAAIPLALFLVVQGQQRLLRHRAERLHSEIVALQLHPGTFADIQRLQREWGYTGKYDGECTPHHCNYLIGLSTWTDAFASQHDLYRSVFCNRVLNFVGHRGSFVMAEVRVHDNRMWGADFVLMTEIRPEGEVYGFPLDVYVRFGPHVAGTHSYYPVSALEKGYEIGRPGACTGCIAGWVNLTPRAPAADIIRLNQLDLTCITRRKQCETIADVIPAAWKEYETVHSTATLDDELRCAAPLGLLTLETQNIALATIVPLTAEEKTYGHTSAARIDQVLKGLDPTSAGARFLFGLGETKLSSLRPDVQPAFLPGSVGKSFLFFYHRFDQRPSSYLDTEPCGVVPVTAANMAVVRQAILDDPSVGEPYDHPISFP